MMFICPHCGSNAFQMLAGVDGRPAAECLKCGRASTFDRSVLSEPRAERTPESSEAEK